jgi:hypothetical protein
MLGQTGRVIIGIPAGGVGQVRCRVGEELVDKIARSHDGAPVPEHSTVRVEEVLGETIVVRRLEAAAPAAPTSHADRLT